MSPEALNELFDARALDAIAPHLALAIGVLAVLVAGILSLPRIAHAAVMVASLATAFVLQFGQLMRPEPIGAVLDGTLLADRTTAAWGLIFIVATAVAWLFSRGYYREDAPFVDEHDALVLTTPIGMLLMAGAQDLIVFFIGLELLSIPLYALAAFRRRRVESVEAGLKYFLLGAFAAAFFLYGAALLYTATGTLALADLRAAGADSNMALIGIAMIAASLFFKISVFPFHLWVPDVYQGSPTPITALMATGTKAAAFAFLLNVTFLLPASAATGIAVIALLTMAAGNLGALVQTDLKRMLAYSGIAHAGTLLLVVAGSLAGDPEPRGAIQAALFYMAAYVFTAGGAFGLIAVLERSTGKAATLDSIRGLSRRRPFVSGALALFMLSLGGIPATGGFLGKWFVFSVAVRADLIGIAVCGVLLSVVALGYYLRVIIALYMQASEPGDADDARVVNPLPATLATLACVVFVVGMGVLPRWFLEHL